MDNNFFVGKKCVYHAMDLSSGAVGWDYDKQTCVIEDIHPSTIKVRFKDGYSFICRKDKLTALDIPYKIIDSIAKIKCV